MSKEPSGWFIRRTDNDMLRCTDGKWRHNAGAVENIKIWKHCTNALKHGERGVPDQGELGGVSFAKVPRLPTISFLLPESGSLYLKFT